MPLTKKIAISTLACIAYWLTLSHWQHDAGSYAFGLWTGYLIADGSPMIRWWRIRRYRRWLAAQSGESNNHPYRSRP